MGEKVQKTALPTLFHFAWVRAAYQPHVSGVKCRHLNLVTFEPLEIQQSNVPHLKALKCGINAVGAQGCSFMSTYCHAPEKIALLLHKLEIVC